jgi:hypothetical protein
VERASALRDGGREARSEKVVWGGHAKDGAHRILICYSAITLMWLSVVGDADKRSVFFFETLDSSTSALSKLGLALSCIGTRPG